MNRRELLKLITAATGSVVAGGEFFLSGCKSSENPSIGTFTEKDISFFDEVAETIIPRTDTPGAKDAEVGRFMAMYSTDCYDEQQLKTLKDGIGKLDDASKKEYGSGFMSINPEQRNKLLTDIDAGAKKYNEENAAQQGKEQAPHYFTLMKQLVLFGFFTSKPGVTQVLRYIPVPGKYQGCIEYKKGETSWA
jgi:hypothetical protein